MLCPPHRPFFQVKKCKEIVTLGISPDKLSYTAAGTHLSPAEFRTAALAAVCDMLCCGTNFVFVFGCHRVVQRCDAADVRATATAAAALHILCVQSSDPNTVILDARNEYESKIGSFQGAIAPPIRQFSDLPR